MAPDADPRRDEEAILDPEHLAMIAVSCMAAAGGLYWLLWTLLVYEGGIASKAKAACALAFTSKTLKDFGYQGYPYAMGVFEGWIGNMTALLLTILLTAALHRIYARARDAARGRQSRHG